MGLDGSGVSRCLGGERDGVGDVGWGGVLGWEGEMR